MSEIVPSNCDVRIRIKGDALWRRVNLGDPLEEEVYLELGSRPHRPIIIDLISQQMRLLVFRGKFEVMKLRDEDVIGSK